MEMYETIKNCSFLISLPHPKATVHTKHDFEGEEKGSTFVKYLPYHIVINLPNVPKFLPIYQQAKAAPASSKEIDKKLAGKDMPPELRDKRKGSKSPGSGFAS